MPSDHQSDFVSSTPVSASGAAYLVVRAALVKCWVAAASDAMPKSVSASSSGDVERIRTFSGLRSRCRMRWAWMPFSASAISLTMRLMSAFGSGPARMRSSSVPPGMYSRSFVSGAIGDAVREHPHHRVAHRLRKDREQPEIGRDPFAIELGHAPFAAAHIGDQQDVGLAPRRGKNVHDRILVAQRRRQRPCAGDHGRCRGAVQPPIAIEATLRARRVGLCAIGVRADDDVGCRRCGGREAPRLRPAVAPPAAARASAKNRRPRATRRRRSALARAGSPVRRPDRRGHTLGPRGRLYLRHETFESARPRLAHNASTCAMSPRPGMPIIQTRPPSMAACIRLPPASLATSLAAST